MVDGWSRRTLGVKYIMIKVIFYGTSYGPNMSALLLFCLHFAFWLGFSFLFVCEPSGATVPLHFNDEQAPSSDIPTPIEGK